ncbi:MAG: glycosyltransferase family 2 protein [Verrucomicrobiota bacterium]
MPDSFQVSVVTPVYNAESTLRRAVESAVNLEEVGEIILVDDAGPDNAFAVAQDLESEFEKVKLVRHLDHGNHGAGASRNLGLDHANFPFVAFLDADDYYLPNRFKKDIELLTQDPGIDGVYGATGIHYESDEARKKFHDAGYGYQEFTTLTAPVEPNELFGVLFGQHLTIKGEFHTDAITVRRSLLERVGRFNPALRLRQDIHLWRRMAAIGRLESGSIDEAIAIRGVHERNRMTDQEEHRKYDELWWSDLEKCMIKLKADRYRMTQFYRALTGYCSRRHQTTKALKALAKWLRQNPRDFTEEEKAFDIHIRSLTKNHPIATRALGAKNKVFQIFSKNQASSH